MDFQKKGCNYALLREQVFSRIVLILKWMF